MITTGTVAKKKIILCLSLIFAYVLFFLPQIVPYSSSRLLTYYLPKHYFIQLGCFASGFALCTALWQIFDIKKKQKFDKTVSTIHNFLLECAMEESKRKLKENQTSPQQENQTSTQQENQTSTQQENQTSTQQENQTSTQQENQTSTQQENQTSTQQGPTDKLPEYARVSKLSNIISIDISVMIEQLGMLDYH